MFIEAEDPSKILAVAPNPDLRNRLDAMFNGSAQASLQSAAENLSYQFLGCSSAAEATAAIRGGIKSGQVFQLALVENSLPDAQGLDLIRSLWQADADLHVVLCCAGQELSWEQIAAKLGESDQLLILEKPFSDLELRQIIHAALRKWQSHNVMRYMEQQIELRTQPSNKPTKTCCKPKNWPRSASLPLALPTKLTRRRNTSATICKPSAISSPALPTCWNSTANYSRHRASIGN
ncbi:response regulator [Methylomonas koyamae]|uniref:response regulator n=1 Tax=Methylomonas koyamae TaxID=702114 RepID=UPI0006CF7322|nr:response regulator [Methylomonas koyamae]